MKRVLVANRGEIAVRVIKACCSLGIETVSAYSETDRGALHSQLADRAVCIGPPRASDSYLNSSSLLTVALGTSCDAVHPGYGFLAENADFAEACSEENLTFVGPSAEAIRGMGDKAQARRKALALGVPIVPGTATPPRSLDDAVLEAGRIGYPILAKAAAGGGGRGMRVVRTASELPEAYQRASIEAKTAFGDGTIYPESYLENTLDIAVQVPGDIHGTVGHFGERDCTMQRKHQKLIEESPSPELTPRLRELILQAAVRIGAGINYWNAGTVEFVVDRLRQEFYFIEMNTRIQVEHPVTEMLTGVDLVAAQLRIATDEALDYIPDTAQVKGHALECRINAEDPSKAFQPSRGTISHWKEPEGRGVRVDTHCHEGCRVSPHYDSLLAKVIVHGNTRKEFLELMRQSLDAFEIEGVTRILPFHRRLLRNDQFFCAQTNTKWVEEVFMEGAAA